MTTMTIMNAMNAKSLEHSTADRPVAQIAGVDCIGRKRKRRIDGPVRLQRFFHGAMHIDDHPAIGTL